MATWHNIITEARNTPITSIMPSGLKKVDREFVGPCPRCFGTDRFSVNPAKRIFNCRKCHGGDGKKGTIDFAMFIWDCDFTEAVQRITGKTKPIGGDEEVIIDWKNPQAFFDYVDEDGKRLYQNVRYSKLKADGSPIITAKGKPDKTFRQRRGVGKKWVYNLDGISQVPYRKRELIAALAADRTVPIFMPEGEAKVDLLLKRGVPATHITKGVKDVTIFQDAEIILLPDNDDAGFQHINTVGAKLAGIAKRIRVLALPDLPVGHDVADWFATGGTVERLWELSDTASEWVAPPVPDDGSLDDGAEKKATLDDGTQKLIDELARLSKLEFEKQRKSRAGEMGMRASALDDEVERRRTELAAERGPPPLYGNWVVEPWPEPVAGGELIVLIISRIRRHVIVTDDQAIAVALWVMMTWVHAEAAIHSPILLVTSAEPNSGKTTLIDLIILMMLRGMQCVGVSEAALFRAIEIWTPSLGIDEADVLFVENEPLRAVVNSGHTRGSGVLRCIGDDHTPKRFLTFCPKLLGMKGLKLPDTTLSRSIIVKTKRKMKADKVTHFSHIDDDELGQLRSRCLRWATDSIDALKKAVPKMPDGFDNRLGDLWRLLFAVADLAGGEWPVKARDAAVAISKVVADLSIGIRLLTDIRTAFAFKDGKDADMLCDRLSTVDLLAALVNMDSSPWCEWKHGKPLGSHGLARLLAQFEIAPDTIRIEGKTAKGYYLAQFQDAFARYL